MKRLIFSLILALATCAQAQYKDVPAAPAAAVAAVQGLSDVMAINGNANQVNITNVLNKVTFGQGAGMNQSTYGVNLQDDNLKRGINIANGQREALGTNGSTVAFHWEKGVLVGVGDNLTGITESNLNASVNASLDLADRAQNTGLYNGGLLSVSTNSATAFNLSAGFGYINDLTDPNTPIVTRIEWTDYNDVEVTAISNQLITFVCITTNGIAQQAARWARPAARDCILIGVVVHVNKTTVDTVNQEQAPAAQVASQIGDILSGLGFVNVSGNTFGNSGANLEIDKTEGVLMASGINWHNDQNNPHHLTLAATNSISFQYRFQGGSNGVTGIVIDPDIYDVGGTSAEVPTAKWTIQRIFLFTSGNVKLQPGQTLYSSVDDALAGLGSDPFVTEPSIVANGSLRGFLIVKKGATDLSDTGVARFVAAGKFGSTAVSAGFSGGDNLGNHIATTTLNGGGNVATNFSTVYAGAVVVDGTNLFTLASASSWHQNVALTSGTNVSVALADGPWLELHSLTNILNFTFEDEWPTNGQGIVSLDLWTGDFSFTLNTNDIDGVGDLTITTNDYFNLVFHKPSHGEKWSVKQ